MNTMSSRTRSLRSGRSPARTPHSLAPYSFTAGTPNACSTAWATCGYTGSALIITTRSDGQRKPTARASRAARDEGHAQEIKTKLEASPVNVKVRSGAGGRLFGAVTTAEIAEAVSAVSRADIRAFGTRMLDQAVFAGAVLGTKPALKAGEAFGKALYG